MQHEALRPGQSGQGLTADTDNVSQDDRETRTVPARQSEPQGEDATPPQEMITAPEAHGETHEADPAARPPIAPPRSWTKDAKAHWQTLPRGIQEYLAIREQERERELRRSQNEVAAKLKGLAAKEQLAEQARQSYETALPSLLHSLNGIYSSVFPDVTSVEDANKLAVDDPPRFKQWQAHRHQMDRLECELRQAHQRQAQDNRAKWSAFASEQDRSLLIKMPELSELRHAQNLMDAAVKLLKEVGFSEGELEEGWKGERFLSFRDYRFQLLVFENARYREQCSIVASAKGNAFSLLPAAWRLTSASDQMAAASEVGAATFIQTLEQQLATANGLAALKLGAVITALKHQYANTR